MQQPAKGGKCVIGSRPHGAYNYVGDVEPHQLELVVLYGHTQHGGCGFEMLLDGEPWPER